MFGFFVGTVCLALLFVTLKRRHHYAGFGAFGSYHHGPWHGGPPWRVRYRHSFAHQLLARLDTTPGQEKAIRATLEALKHNLNDARDDLAGIRGDVAQALGGDVLDEQALSAALEKQEQFVSRARNEVVQAIKALHEILDGSQRRYLAEWIANGMSLRDLRRWPYRGWF